ncbi:MAG TPA: MEDS domain-containing protein [Pseudonocardiaceae bacterium]|nr:MEDS domain-containing protein [Pseudonocardiaceae bacterium]
MCGLVGSAAERVRMVHRFVRSGLAAGDRVWCFANGCRPEVLSWLHQDGGGDTNRGNDGGHIDDGAAMACGQLVVQPTHESVLSVLGFNPASVVDDLRRAVDDALDEGWNGFRMVGDLGWATRGPDCIPHLMDFETSVGKALTGSPAATLCQYDRHRFDANTMAALAGAHAAMVGSAAMPHEAGLSCVPLTWPAPGLRLVGEVDLSNHDVLRTALDAAMVGTEDLHLELSELTFIDHGGTRILIRAAHRLGPARRLVLHQPPLSLSVGLMMSWETPNLVIDPTPGSTQV